MKFGEQLKTYRNKLNFTQEEMANFLSFGLKTYQSWEQGTRRPLKTYQDMIIKRIERKMGE